MSRSKKKAAKVAPSADPSGVAPAKMTPRPWAKSSVVIKGTPVICQPSRKKIAAYDISCLKKQACGIGIENAVCEYPPQQNKIRNQYDGRSPRDYIFFVLHQLNPLVLFISPEEV